MSNPARLFDLLGRTLIRAERIGDERIEFVTKEGLIYSMHHPQDCCEDVYIESVVGDLSDLIGEPLLIAEEAVHEGTGPVPPKHGNLGENGYGYTWTFYKFATRKGYVDIRWFGTSNGYYSERVGFVLVNRYDK